MKCGRFVLPGLLFVFLLNSVAFGIDFQGTGFVRADQAQLAALENQTNLNISVSAVWTLDIKQDLLRLDWNATVVGGSGSYKYQGLVNHDDVYAVGSEHNTSNLISDGMGFREPFPSSEVELTVSVTDHRTNKKVSKKDVLVVPQVLCKADGSLLGLYNGTIEQNQSLNESKIVSTMSALG